MTEVLVSDCSLSSVCECLDRCCVETGLNDPPSKRPPNTGAKLWGRVRSKLLRQKVRPPPPPPPLPAGGARGSANRRLACVSEASLREGWGGIPACHITLACAVRGRCYLQTCVNWGFLTEAWKGRVALLPWGCFSKHSAPPSPASGDLRAESPIADAVFPSDAR